MSQEGHLQEKCRFRCPRPHNHRRHRLLGLSQYVSHLKVSRHQGAKAATARRNKPSVLPYLDFTHGCGCAGTWYLARLGYDHTIPGSKVPLSLMR
jgi:hypothetical protein